MSFGLLGGVSSSAQQGIPDWCRPVKLAITGSDTETIISFALLAIALGVTLVVVAKRRRAVVPPLAVIICLTLMAWSPPDASANTACPPGYEAIPTVTGPNDQATAIPGTPSATPTTSPETVIPFTPVPTPGATVPPATPTMAPATPVATPTTAPGTPTATPTTGPGTPTATPTTGPGTPTATPTPTPGPVGNEAFVQSLQIRSLDPANPLRSIESISVFDANNAPVPFTGFTEVSEGVYQIDFDTTVVVSSLVVTSSAPDVQSAEVLGRRDAEFQTIASIDNIGTAAAPATLVVERPNAAPDPALAQYLRIAGSDAGLTGIAEVDLLNQLVADIAEATVLDDASGAKAAVLDGDLSTTWSALSANDYVDIKLASPSDLALLNVRSTDADQATDVLASDNGVFYYPIASTASLGSLNAPYSIFVGAEITDTTRQLELREDTAVPVTSLRRRATVGAGGIPLRYPTGLYVDKGSILQIHVEQPADPGTATGYWLAGRRYWLPVGTTTVRAPDSGVIVMMALNEDETIIDTARMTFSGNGLTAANVYDVTADPDGDAAFIKMVQSLPPRFDEDGNELDDQHTQDVVLVGENIMIITDRFMAAGSDTLEISRTLQEEDFLIKDMFAFNGFTDEPGSIHGPIRNYMVVVTVPDCDCYMAANGTSVLAVSDEAIRRRLISVSDPGLYAGLYHEFGHNFQVKPWLGPIGSGEAAPNIISSRARKTAYQAAGLDWVGPYTAAITRGQTFADNLRASGTLSADTLSTIGSQGILLQLNYELGDEVITETYRTYRQMVADNAPELAFDNENYQFLSYILTRVTGQDFRPYLANWGLTTPDEVNAAIDALNPTSVFDPELAFKDYTAG